MPIEAPHKKRPVSKAIKIARLRDSFAYFLTALWLFLGLPAPTPAQLEMADYLQNGPKRLMLEAFRGVGKSWITAAFVIWHLWRNPNFRFLVVSASKDRSDAFSIFVKKVISEWPLTKGLVAKAGKAVRDSNIAFDVQGAEPDQAPSVKSVGITGQLTGSRADIIIADDVENPKNSLTELQRERLAELVKEFDAVLNEPDASSPKHGLQRIIYLGTPQTEMSLYNRLPKRGYAIRIWPARYPSVEKLRAAQERYWNVGGAGDLYAPSVLRVLNDAALVAKPVDTRFDDNTLLEREASYGRTGFSMQFMLDTSVGDADRYPLKLADFVVMDVDMEQAPVFIAWAGSEEMEIPGLHPVGLTGDRWHRPLKMADDWKKFDGTMMFIDPSGRGKDETAYAIVRHLSGKLFLVKAGGFLGGYTPETLRQLAHVAKRYKVNEIQVEPNFGGGMFPELLKPVLADEGWGCLVEDAQWSRGQKERRIIDTLEPVLNQHRLIVDRRVIEQDLKVEDPSYQLFYQLTRLTGDRGSLAHDDRVEAVAGAVSYWSEALARSQMQLEAQRKAELLDHELRNWANHVVGYKQPMRSAIQHILKR